jgi:hypothetical protein
MIQTENYVELRTSLFRLFRRFVVRGDSFHAFACCLAQKSARRKTLAFTELFSVS